MNQTYTMQLHPKMAKDRRLQQFFLRLPPTLRRHIGIRALNAILPNSDCQLILYNNSCFAYIDITDPNPRNYFLKGIFEPDMIRLGVALGAEACVDLDIGANFGLWGLGVISSKEYKGMGMHFFEPNPHCFSYIEKSLADFYEKNSRAINAATGPSDGESFLAINKDELGQSHISRYMNGVPVRCIALDSYINNLNIQALGVIKMDIEGYEVETLHGMKQVLESMPPRAFIMECYDGHFHRYGTDSTELISMMKSYGYRVFLFREKDHVAKVFDECCRFRFYQDGCPFLINLDGSLPENYGTDILAIRGDLCEHLLYQV